MKYPHTLVSERRGQWTYGLVLVININVYNNIKTNLYTKSMEVITSKARYSDSLVGGGDCLRNFPLPLCQVPSSPPFKLYQSIVSVQ